MSTNGFVFWKSSASTGGTMYYVHTDHLGSYTMITDQSRNRIDSLWFDAWGNRRHYKNWLTADTRTSFFFDRGFTGHEHLDRFKIINMNGRLYDPVIARFFSPDPFVQMPNFTQNFNRYSYCLNNPLMFTDPSGEFLQIVAYALSFFGDLFSNLINGVSQPFQTAANNASTVVNGMANCLQFPIQTGDNYSLTIGINPFALGVSANMSYSMGNTSFGISAGWGAMSSWFASAGVSQKIGDAEIGLGIGAGKNYWGWNASASYAGFGIGYGQTNYGNAQGPDIMSNAQRVGSASLLFPGGSFTLQNDFLAFQGQDRWRSNAVELTIGKATIGTWLYNNDPGNMPGEYEDKIDKLGTNLMGKTNRLYKGEQKYGAWINGQTYASPLYFGYRFGNRIERIGYSHPMVQDRTQNLIHRWVPFGRQNYYNRYEGNSSRGIYLYTGYYNSFSIWHPNFSIW